ncbi:hypothetical protein TSTA_102090 [Talaromyces stipitatus ATCC 10500]|uniref:Reverse transcriptase Ty1/copia-type domain-containing protein n=1 Tax=Talaromyces stipitatus (strain ATCC 10500 / CBS 375.48 / QM 6759 / NRRL 1006) TaxID=441959 RepID=B8MN30_TALSN|nr:uncharacterized protein TSTA_102090 [Talaromyces stipitatus ATCC 10500]EED13979.1 hypothetical protein TSTA_102090 [Talaromyces stipitatus ATCC 10500]
MAINKDSYTLHAVDPYTKFHALVTTHTKSVNFDLETLIEQIEHTFKTKVDEIHIDGESSLNGISFKEYLTVPYTPEQNGPSERAGGIITMKSQSLTPIESLGYMTPYEKAFGKKPYIGNLFLFGSKAYVKINTKKSDKMALRAQIGFLKYDPDHPFAKEIVKEGITKYVGNIDIPNIDEADPNIVFDSVDNDMRLQQFSVSLGKTMTGGSTSPHEHANIEQPTQPLDMPQNMEIDSTSTESVEQTQIPQEMEIDTPTEPGNIEIDGNRTNQAQVDNHENSMMEIGSAGGVEDKNEDKNKNEVDVMEKEAEDEDIPKLDGKTNNPTNQPRQLPNPERDSASQNTSNQLDDNNDNMRTNQLITPPTTPPNQTTGQEAPRAQEISADLSESNIVAGSRIRKASNRALSPTSISAGPSKTSKRDRSPEPSPISRKRQRKLSRAFLARQKLLQDSTTNKIFLAAMEKLEEPFSVQLPPEPKNWKGVLRHKFKHQFTQAAKEEFEALKRKGTFEFIPKPQDKQILPLTWVFKYKFDKYSKLATFKARIYIRGDLQQPNDLEKRAATLAARNFRIMMAIAAIFDLEIVQYDAMNAFVNSILDEEVYTYFLDGFKQDGQVIKLQRALYGLRRSPQLWQKELTATLLNLGFTQIPDEECLFIKNSVVLLFYVNDILLFYDKATKQATFKEIEKGLMRKYELRKIKKFEWFLNIRITRDRAQRKIWLCQDSQIKKMASKFGINATNNIKTPISGNIKASTEQAINEEIHAYQELVGSALYVAVMTRVDVAKAVNELAKHTKNPSKAHF